MGGLKKMKVQTRRTKVIPNKVGMPVAFFSSFAKGSVLICSYLQHIADRTNVKHFLLAPDGGYLNIRCKRGCAINDIGIDCVRIGPFYNADNACILDLV